MRVLTLCSAFPPVAGGAETYIDVLTTGLAESGHDVLVLTDGTTGVPDCAHGPRRVRPLTGYRELIEDPSKLRWEQMYFGLLPEIADAVRDWRPDVVLANNMETTILGRMVAEETGAGLVGSYHEHAPDEEPLGHGKVALAYRWLAPDAVLAGSRYYAERALRYTPADRVHLIHHGVDTDAFHPGRDGRRMRERYGIPSAAVLVVNVGRLKERKGQIPLIRAVATLADPRVYLVIAGGISSASLSYAAELRAEVDRLRLAGRVTIDQHVSHAEVPDLLAAADIVAQPSLSEGLGLALLEAMSAGRPAVATRIDGFVEILTSGDGMAFPDDLVALADPGDAASLAAALTQLIARPSHRAALAAAARKHVERYFSRHAMIAKTEQVLRRTRKVGAA
jgi:glycosyltransferase involved in cell wall biosynthesis